MAWPLTEEIFAALFLSVIKSHLYQEREQRTKHATTGVQGESGHSGVWKDKLSLKNTRDRKKEKKEPAPTGVQGGIGAVFLSYMLHY